MEIDIDMNSDYLSSKNCQTGDVVVIADEGVKAQIKKQGTNEVKEVYNFKVVCNDKEYTYTPNIKTLKLFISVWGKDSKNWIGKKFTVKLVVIEVAGKEMTVIRPQIIEQKA